MNIEIPAGFTYGDYQGWPEEQRWELINGVAYAMTAPSRLHQLVSFELGFQIRSYLADKKCSIYAAPFDIRLPRYNEADSAVDTTIQPDLAVICNASKLDNKGCRGAPDWIIEVLSPSTAFKDMDTKRRLYEQHSVQEYWIIHPSEYWLMIYTLRDGRYAAPRMASMDEPTAVDLFPDLAINWEFMASERETRNTD
ncbi:MAG: hypothetical protein CR991_04455 [Proteobacteria bacterium]|nr:MAG: hypothetical protein CR991_04455 [Pseudomonadota bacterium]